MTEEIRTLKSWVEESEHIVFFGGAGVSTESNIPDFRSDEGIYNQGYKFPYPAETMLSHSFYKSHTEEFFDFHRKMMICTWAKPNAAHLKLAELEERGKLKAVVTQNIDGLHQMAGSKTVYELHGSVYRNYCVKCGKFHDVNHVLEARGIPLCQCGGVVKPDVVLYEEMLDNDTVENAVSSIRKCDMLIVGGTSLSVYPAAGLVDYYKGKKLVLINKTATPYDGRADLIIRDKIGEVFSQI
ncbi:MAG: NAD-dependent protein deacylase [Oscillospiraceae bacterium]|nr:NAD-dependent protein deacylase [Oscillospiraceae bacterium]